MCVCVSVCRSRHADEWAFFFTTVYTYTHTSVARCGIVATLFIIVQFVITNKYIYIERRGLITL